jgi:hypothetical protein
MFCLPRCVTVAALALALAAPARAADAPAPPGTAPAGGGTPGAAAAPVSKKCATVRRRVEKEEKSLATATEQIARDREARVGCSPKSACDRYDHAIRSMEARKERHETRLARFRSDAERICKGQ